MKPKHTINKGNRLRYLTTVVALTLTCSAHQVKAASNLVDFEFNEGPGSATTTAKANNLVGYLGRTINRANDPVLTADSPAQTSGDSSIRLNGVGFLVADDAVNPVLAIQTNAFTIELWMKWDYMNEIHTLGGFVGYGSSYKLGYMNGNIVFTAFGVADIDSTLPMPADGAWHHVAAAWQPGVSVTFYLDGAATEAGYTGAFQTPANHLLTIGGERVDNPFTGNLDRLRIHKGFLPASELDSIASAPKAPLAGTVLAYNFNDSSLLCQSTTTPARPAINSEDHLANATSPTFSSDTPSGQANDHSLNFVSGMYIQAPDVNNVIAIDPANPSFTAEAWAKFANLPQTRSVLFGYNGPGGAFSFSVTSDRKVFVTAYGILDIPSQAAVPNDGIWHHVAVVHENGKEMRFYVDGILGDTVPYAGGLIFTRTDTTLIIGAEPGLWNWYVGSLDRVRITAGVLNADQLDYLAIPGVIPGAPAISTALAQQISWPTFPAGYRLESSPTLDPATAVWSPVTNTPYVNGTNYAVYLPVSGTRMFYRLVK